MITLSYLILITLFAEEGNMIHWTIREVDIVPVFPWKIARSTTARRTNFIVQVESSGMGGQGEVAYGTHFGETRDLVLWKFEEFVGNCPPEVKGLEQLTNILDHMDLPLSLRFGIESSFVHFLAKLAGNQVWELLAMKQVTALKTSFSIPILAEGEMEEFVSKYQLQRFTALKVKISADYPAINLEALRRMYRGSIRLDANEAWRDPDAVLAFVAKVRHLGIELLEQPLVAHLHQEYCYLKTHCSIPLFADESLRDGRIDGNFAQGFSGVNIKLMKSGGYVNAIRQMREAREQKLQIMLGCSLETSLGISSAFNVAAGADLFDLDGSLLLQSEPFGLLCEENGRLFMSQLQ